jgi:O-antigen/teichoic acid export membrane protein
MLRFGGWLTIDNLISPLMATMDRFLVSGILTISVVGYYATANDVVTRMLIVPTALQSVVFSALSRSIGGDQRHARKIFASATEMTLLSILPVTTAATLFADLGFQLWLGDAFAERSAPVFRILTLGVLVNALAHVPSALLQSVGRPDLNVRIHALELPVYSLCAYALMKRFGIDGAAIAWVIRVTVDAVAFFWCARKWMPGAPISLGMGISALAAAALAQAAVAAQAPMTLRLFFVVAVGAACLWVVIIRVRAAAYK